MRYVCIIIVIMLVAAYLWEIRRISRRYDRLDKEFRKRNFHLYNELEDDGQTEIRD